MDAAIAGDLPIYGCDGARVSSTVLPAWPIFGAGGCLLRSWHPLNGSDVYFAPASITKGITTVTMIWYFANLIPSFLGAGSFLCPFNISATKIHHLRAVSQRTRHSGKLYFDIRYSKVYGLVRVTA